MVFDGLHGCEALDRDIFLRKLLRELSGLLQEVVGLEDSAGFIASVGASMGRWMDDAYREHLETDALDVRAVAGVFVDLKGRLGGAFEVIDLSPERIVLRNTTCPFGEMVRGRSSLCMMTSSVFGRIAADNLGYAHVELEQTIARGDPCCVVTVNLRPPAERHRFRKDGQEYYATRKVLRP